MDFPRLSPKEALILELLISHGELYGLELVEASGGALKRGTVYVTLGRMADKGYVESRQVKEEGEAGLPRRVFQATGYGVKALRVLEIGRRVMAGGLADAASVS